MFQDKFILIFKNFTKIVKEAVGLFLFVVAILSLFLAIYGPEKVYNKLVAILDDIFNSRISLQIMFIAILAVIVITAIVCIKWVHNIKWQMSREYEKNDDCLKRILTLLQSEKNLGVLSMDLRTSPKYNNDIYKRIW